MYLIVLLVCTLLAESELQQGQVKNKLKNIIEEETWKMDKDLTSMKKKLEA
jgi:hypothetical protein